MKKKILVPIMALAMIISVGVNYEIIRADSNSQNYNLSSLAKISNAQAEFEFEETDGQYTSTVECPDGSTFEGTDCDMSGGGCEYDDTSGCNY